MRSGELQGLPQGERKTKTVYQAKTKSHHPAALQAAAAGDVFERHVNDRNRDERFDQRRKPQKIWCEVVGRGEQRDRMRDGERSDDGNERAETAKWDYQTQQKKQMVGAVQNVEKTQVDKSQGRLMPPRVEADQAGIAGEFERANSATGWQKPKNGDDAQAEAREAGMNGAD